MSASKSEEYEVKGSQGMGLVGATFGFFVGFTAVALISPLGSNFKSALGISTTMLGFLVAAPQLTGSLLRIPFGAWVDKAGGKRPLLTLLSIAIVGLAGMSAILLAWYPGGFSQQTYPIVMLFAVLCGAGVATFSVGVPQTSYWFPQKKQGYALGIYAGLGNTAPGMITLILPFVLSALGMAGIYVAWLILVIAGTLIYAFIAHDAPYFQLRAHGLSREKSVELAKKSGEELIPSGQFVGALKVSAKSWRNWALVALYFVSFGGFLALTTWLPTYWRLGHGMDLRSAAVLTAVGFTLLASFVRAGGGKPSDRYGGENVALASFLLILAGALVMVSTSSFWVDVVGEVILAAGMGLGNASVFKLVARYVPEAVGGASGWVGGLGAFGGFVIPPVLGYFVDSFGNAGYSFGFVTYGVLAVLALLVTVTLRARPPEKGRGPA